MEKLKSITIIFLLSVGLLTSVAPAKTVSVLLQEGLYAEEIEGDLDAAIKIYEQVISESKETQRAATQATYRIGMCFLKKGKKDKAAEYFQNTITDFPSQKVLARKAEKQLDKIKPRAERIVEQAVMTISTCAEGDPRVAKALESLKGLDENVVVNELVKFLNSETNTVRRSAIYILWKGDLKDISAAVPTLKKLCSHQEDITRGMAAIALGASKTDSSFDVLCNITLKDPSGYARRCAAYTLGLMGNAEAKPILEKALEDSDLLVRNNAKAALTKLGPAFMGSIDYAESVPVDQLIKSGKVPAFKTQIYDNTGLDLETGVSVPFMDEWPALCDVAWDNDGGGALMIKPRTSVRFLALGAAEKWEDAISMARNSLGVLRTSTSKGMFASQSKFVAVLTNEGNLAVIQIGEYDAKQGTIYGWVEKIPAVGFGPVIERVVYHGGTVHECLIDFESGKLFKVPEGLKDSRGKESEVLEWVKETGGDAAGDTEGPITSQGLQGFVNDLVAQPVADGWNTSPRELVATMGSLLPEPHGKARMFAKGALPATYFFKTRDGGMGVLQILGFTIGDPRGVKVRYKMLQQKLHEIVTLIKEMHEPEAQRFAALNKLIKIGAPAVEPLISELQKSNNWQVPKALGAIGDKRAVEPLIKKWQKCDWSPMKEVISEALERITGKKLGQDKQKWQNWLQEKTKSPIDLSTPEATIKSFVKAVYDGNLEAAGTCVSKDGHDYDEFKEMLTTESKSNHPFLDMIKAMDVSVPIEITSKSIEDGKCKISWLFMFGRVYYFGETKMKKGTPQEFSSYLELVGDKWLIRDI